jgi:hypothetical protein
VSRASSFTGDSWKFRNNASLMTQGSSYCTICISIVRLIFPKRYEYRKCGTVWYHYNIVTTWCNPKKHTGPCAVRSDNQNLRPFTKTRHCCTYPSKKSKRGTCYHFTYRNMYCPHAVIVFWGTASIAPPVTSHLLQAKIPNTVTHPAWIRPISSVFVVSNLTTLPKAVLHNPKSY